MPYDRDLQATAVATSYLVGSGPVNVAPANAARAEVAVVAAGPIFVGVASNMNASSGLPAASGAIFPESLHLGDLYAHAPAGTVVVVRWESSYGGA